MGDWYQTIADVDATAAEAPHLADMVVSWLLETGVVPAGRTDWIPGSGEVDEPLRRGLNDGHGALAVTVGRSVFYSGWASTVTCPQCRHLIELDDSRGSPNQAWHALSDAISAWYDGGEGTFPCRNCSQPVGLNEWGWHPPWGFGYLGSPSGTGRSLAPSSWRTCRVDSIIESSMRTASCDGSPPGGRAELAFGGAHGAPGRNRICDTRSRTELRSR